MCVEPAQSEQSSTAHRRRMEAAIAESVDLRAQLQATQVEATTGQAAVLRTIDVIEYIEKSIFTLKTVASRVSG